MGDDGKPYTDFVCGLGSNILSANNTLSLEPTLMVEVAEMLVARFPIDKLKFLKTGSEACSAAVRIARAFTGRKFVVGSGYHGWHNLFIEQESPGVGCMWEGYTKRDKLEDVTSWVRTYRENFAAAIVEPLMLDLDVRDKLHDLRKACTETGTVLIFDETITGMRVPGYCAAAYYSVAPDLLCLGKGIANGMPLSIVGGRVDVMDVPDYFISSTFAADYASLKECHRVLQIVTRDRIGELWTLGTRLMNEFNAINPGIQLVGIPTRCTWGGDADMVNVFWQEMCRRQYILGKAFWISFSHTDAVVDKFIADSKECIKSIVDNGTKLDGLPPRPVFKRY
jgi:glutamate-1-semialdehyde aminotransferase